MKNGLGFTAHLPQQRAGYLTSTITDSGRDHANTINGKWRSLVQRCECIDSGIEDGEEGRAAMEESANNLRRIMGPRETSLHLK